MSISEYEHELDALNPGTGSSLYHVLAKLPNENTYTAFFLGNKPDLGDIHGAICEELKTPGISEEATEVLHHILEGLRACADLVEDGTQAIFTFTYAGTVVLEVSRTQLKAHRS